MSSSIVNYLKNYKRVYIIYSTDLDAILSASMLLQIAREEDIKIYLASFYTASKPMDSDALLILIKVFQKSPVGGLKIIQIDDVLGKDPRVSTSITLHIVKELKKSLILSKYLEVISLAAMLSLSRSSVYDDNLISVHKNLIEESIDKNLYTFVDSIRLFGYPKRDVIESLVRTVDPYIVGISLDYEGSKKLLESIGGLQNEETKTKFINILNNMLVNYNKSGISILGPKIILRDVDIVDDIYETVYMFYAYMDLIGVDPILYACIDSRILDIIKGAYNYVLKYLKEFIDTTINENKIRKMVIRGIKVSVLDISTLSTIPPLYTSYRILRSLGLVDEIVAFTNGKEFLLPLPFIMPRWPYDKELHIERNYVVFTSLQDLGEVFK